MSLSATDEDSGVERILYTTNGIDPSPINGSTYVAPFQLSTTTTLKFRAYDRAGNEEGVGSTAVQIDTTPPPAPDLVFGSFIAASATGTTVYFRPGEGGFTLTATSEDAESGVAQVTFPSLGDGWSGGGPDESQPFTMAYAFDYSALEPTGAATVTAEDRVGRTVERAFDVLADDTAPATNILCGGVACHAPPYAEPVAVSLSAEDTGSGVAEIRYTLDGSWPTAESGTEYTGPVTLASTRTIRYLAWDEVGNTEYARTFRLRVERETPDPTDVATAVQSSVPTTVSDSTAFLYTGDNPVQLDVEPGTIQARRAAVVRGRVTTRAGAPIEGAEVTVLDHPELGWTTTRADGLFDLAVNGGGLVTLSYEKRGFLPSQREVEAPWQDFTWAEDVVLVPVDSRVTEVDLSAGGPAEIQVARGTEVEDDDGSRQATVFFEPGTEAEMALPDGSVRPLATLDVRATEYTVGDSGPEAMPGELPPTSGYTYAVELSVDEALAAGATDVRLSKPVPFYVENFLGFPIGTIVPNGYYDRDRGEWVASDSGRVIEIVAEPAGQAEVDTDGDGDADNTGIDGAERGRLAALYAPGDELWRTEMSHFTPWDSNWGWGPPPDAELPNGSTPLRLGGTNQGKGKCEGRGSIIGCRDQTLGEVADIVGTPYSLRYISDRVPGRLADRVVVIPLSGATVPASLRQIILEISVAGQHTVQTFAPGPNLSQSFSWDGKDSYGRTLQGEHLLHARIGFVYGGVYQATSRFGYNGGGGGAITGNPSRQELTLWRDWSSPVGGWDALRAGIGGWSLEQQHTYASTRRTLYQGDGERRTAEDLNVVATTVAGDSVGGFLGDGGPATSARIEGSTGIAAAPDGGFYITDAYRVRRVAPDGTINTFAGRGERCPDPTNSCGDGGFARQARLGSAHDVALGPDGSLYIADSATNRIRRVDLDGIITTVAGSGSADPGPNWERSGDGGPALEAAVTAPTGVDVGPDGSLYIADHVHDRIRKVGTDGIITTIAGGGPAQPGTGDGGPATSARLKDPWDVVVGPAGDVYFADHDDHRVRRVSVTGIITTAAGTGQRGFSGDGGPAVAAEMNEPFGIDVGPDGTVYIAEAGKRVRQVDPTGTMSTIAGSGQQCLNVPITPTAWGYDCFDKLPALRTRFFVPWSVALAADGSILVGDPYARLIRKIASALPGFDVAQNVVPASDGLELYVFGASGRHLETRDTLTGAVRDRFGYDLVGRLITAEDESGNVTRFERDAAGNPSAIVAPGGQRTTLAVDANGYLSRIENPAGEAVELSSTSGGLLTGVREPGGATHSFGYDLGGLLVRDEGPAGVQTLFRSALAGGWTVTLASPGGRARAYEVQRLGNGNIRTAEVAAGGARTETIVARDATSTTTFPTGTTLETLVGPDPRFGMQAPIIEKLTRRSPGGKVTTMTASRTAELTNPADVMSLVRQTDTVSQVSRGSARTEYVAAPRTLRTTSLGGRSVVRTLDAKGRVVRIEPAEGITPTTFDYDALGRVVRADQGARSVVYGYDDRNRLVSRTDAAGTRTWTYDDADRALTATLPGGRLHQMTYSADGRLASVTLPSGAVHRFAYSAAGDLARYEPAGSAAYQRSFSAEQELQTVTLPGGREQAHGRQAITGLPTGISYVEAATAFEYDGAGRATRAAWTAGGGGAQQTSFAYDGDLVTSAASTGLANSSYAYEYDNDFELVGATLDSQPKTVLARDFDGLVTSNGAFSIARAGPGRSESRISGAGLTVDVTYDVFGRLATRTHAVGATQVYRLELAYDDANRVTSRTETAGTGATTLDYAYDSAGQLTGVAGPGDGEAYTYDADGNRLSRRLPDGTIEAASYDARGTLVSRGLVDYVFDADGFLSRRGDDVFEYSARGELLEATVGGTTVSYGYDAFGRRVSRTEGGATTQYLYGNPESPLEVTATKTGGVLTTYFRDDHGRLYALERAGSRYFVATDQVGTPKVVTDSAGVVVRSLQYDTFGVPATGSGTFSLPFGFAGGLADEVTGLLRFGFRDYDPEAGRWTARDPVLFQGGQTNFYAYAANDPASRYDSSGLGISAGGTLCAGVCAGAKIAFTGEGMSICFEVGFGAGASVDIDPGAGLDPDSEVIGAEASFSAGPASVSASISLDDCGNLKTGLKAGVGPFVIDEKLNLTESFGVGDDALKQLGAKKLGPKIGKGKLGAQAKLTGTVCRQMLW